MHENGIDSVRSIRIARSPPSGFTGAKPKPQLPIAPVDTPRHLPAAKRTGPPFVPPLSAAS
jgi:hypothetical protein